MSYRIDLRLLRYFAVAAEQTNLTRASQILNLAQPALSRQIKVLEDELGATLFHRLPRGMRLTSAGERLLTHAYEVMDRVNYMLEDMEQVARGRVGAIEIGLSPVALDTPLVGQILESSSRMSPDIDLKLRSYWSSKQIKQLKDFEQDVGFLFLECLDPQLTTVMLDEQRLVLGMSADHPLAQLDRISIDDLRPYGFIQTPAFVSGTLREILAAQSFEPRIVQETADTRLLLQLVSAGIGLAVVNSTWAKSEGVVVRELSDVDVPLPLYVCRRAAEHRPEVLRFFDHVVEIGTRGTARADVASSRLDCGFPEALEANRIDATDHSAPPHGGCSLLNRRKLSGQRLRSHEKPGLPTHSLVPKW